MPSKASETSTTTYSGPRSRCGPTPRSSSTTAPPTSARSTGKRSLTRRTYLPSSSRLMPPPLTTAGIVSVEVALGVGADAGDGEPLGIDGLRDLGDLLVRDAVQARDRLVGIDRLVEDDALVGAVAGHRVGVLEGEGAPAGGVRAGALDLLLGRAVAVQLGDDLLHAREGLRALARVQPGADRQHARVGERVVDRPHRVAEPALLADLVEQARAHRAAEQRRVDRHRRALGGVGDVDAGRVGHAQVRLVGVALLDADAL